MKIEPFAKTRLKHYYIFSGHAKKLLSFGKA